MDDPRTALDGDQVRLRDWLPADLRPDEPPPVPHLEIDNRCGAPPLPTQLDQAVSRMGGCS